MQRFLLLSTIEEPVQYRMTMAERLTAVGKNRWSLPNSRAEHSGQKISNSSSTVRYARQLCSSRCYPGSESARIHPRPRLLSAHANRLPAIENPNGVPFVRANARRARVRTSIAWIVRPTVKATIRLLAAAGPPVSEGTATTPREAPDAASNSAICFRPVTKRVSTATTEPDIATARGAPADS
jgi:hypothetical protein